MPRQIVSHADLIESLRYLLAGAQRVIGSDVYQWAAKDAQFVDAALKAKTLIADAEAMYSQHPIDMDAAFDRLLNEIGAHK